MYKPYLDIIEREKSLGLFQPRHDMELLVPTKPLPGIYNGHIWDVIEAGDKLIVRLDLGGGVFFDWEIWARQWQSDKPSWLLTELLNYWHVREPRQLIGRTFKGAKIDKQYNVLLPRS